MRVVPAGRGWERAQERKVVAEKRGMAASRCTPRARSTKARSGRERSSRLASGATGRARAPISDGRLTIQSRRERPPRSATIRVRATVLISAIITPSGHAWVHSPQPEQ